MGTDAKLSKKDFDAGVDVRWCPGCGDYAILSTVQRTLASLGVAREKQIFISGIGCSSRLPYYMNAYGFHTIHGRAAPIATGLKLARPDLDVWVITGDGDSLSIGAGHFLHTIRRNVNIKILLFNNRIYGLTKGQTSPTSGRGTRTKSTPGGSIDNPFAPLPLAIAAGATFVARAVDTEAKSLQEVLMAAYAHQGTAVIEILQNCNVFNDGVFDHITGREIKHDKQVQLVNGKPLIYGSDASMGIAMDGLGLRVGKIGSDVQAALLLLHDQAASVGQAFAIAQLEEPVAMGVIRAVAQPTYDSEVTARRPLREEDKSSLEALLRGNDSWSIGARIKI